jgi:hypothetical protein
MPTHPAFNLTIPNLDQLHSVEDLHEVAAALELAAQYARTLARQWQAEADDRPRGADTLKKVTARHYRAFPAWLQWRTPKGD